MANETAPITRNLVADSIGLTIFKRACSHNTQQIFFTKDYLSSYPVKFIIICEKAFTDESSLIRISNINPSSVACPLLVNFPFVSIVFVKISYVIL